MFAEKLKTDASQNRGAIAPEAAVDLSRAIDAMFKAWWSGINPAPQPSG